MVDFYTPADSCGERTMFFSPELAAGEYEVSVGMVGEYGSWTTKNGTVYGSDDTWVTITSAAVVRDVHAKADDIVQ